MLFDSWAGVLSPGLFRAHVMRTTRAIVGELGRRHADVPVIGFPRLAGLLIGDYVRKTGVRAVGLDTGMDISLVKSVMTRRVPFQGNLDPWLCSPVARPCGPKRPASWKRCVTGRSSSIWAMASCRRRHPRTWRNWWSRCVPPEGCRKVAVVLFNLGGPDRPSAVRPFLLNLFRDPAILRVPFFVRSFLARAIAYLRLRAARANYALLNGRSPLLDVTRAQAAALQAALPDLRVKCFIAMRYWHPFSDATAQAVRAWRPDDVVLLPLYPQYSTTTTASSLAAWHDAAAKAGLVAATHTVCCYATDHAYIASIAALLRDAYTKARVLVCQRAHRCACCSRPTGFRKRSSPRAIPINGRLNRPWRRCCPSGRSRRSTGQSAFNRGRRRCAGWSRALSPKSSGQRGRKWGSCSFPLPLFPSIPKRWSSSTLNTGISRNGLVFPATFVSRHQTRMSRLSPRWPRPFAAPVRQALACTAMWGHASAPSGTPGAPAASESRCESISTVTGRICHCEERSDEAIPRLRSSRSSGGGLLSSLRSSQ